MFKVLKWILGITFFVLAVVVIGGYVFLKTFDLNKYKSYVEELVYKQTGRTLALNGEAGLKVSLIPTLVLNDVSLSNAEWATPKSMVTAEKIEVSLDVLPLLRKQLVIDTVELIKPEIYLSVNKDGTPNWSFTKPDADTSNETTAETENTETKTSDTSVAESSVALAIVAKHLQIDNGKVVYSDLKNKASHNVDIRSIKLSSEGMSDPIDLSFDISYNDQTIKGTATTGAITNVLQNTPDFPVSADITAYGAQIKTDMTLNNLLGDLSYNGTLNVKNPKGNFGAPAVTLKTALSGSLQNIVATIEELNVSGNVMTGKVTADLSKSTPAVTADLKSALINVATLTETSTAYNIGLISTAEAAAYVPDTALDLSALKSVNATLKAEVTKLIVNDDLSLSDIKVSAVLKNGTLNLSSLTADAGNGTIKASGSLTSAGKMTLNASGQKIIAQELLKSLTVKDSSAFGIQSGGQTDFKIELSGEGATLRKLVESLKGQVLFVVGESKLQTGSLKYLSGNFLTQILNTLNISTTKDMTLQCAVVRADLASGKASFPNGIVFNADQLAIVGDGTVNLESDKISISLHPFNNKLTDTNIAQALSSLLKISGTVQSPSISVDSTSVIKNVVGVAAAGPAYIGASIVLESDEAPCYTALKDTAYKDMFPAPTGVKATTTEVYQNTGQIINDGISAVTDTAKDLLKALKK